MENITANKISGCEAPLFNSKAISSHLLELGYPQNSLDSMLKCGTKSPLKLIKACGCGSSVIELPVSCNLRTCPRCAEKRKMRIRRDYEPVLAKFNTNPHNREFLYFLTISPANYDDYKTGLNHIRKSFSKFLRNKYVKERVLGGLYVIEAKNTGKGWNVHIHAIIYGRWLDNKVRKNPDSKIVTIFKRCSQRAVTMNIQRQGSALYSLNYMLKYISANKGDFLDVKMMATYIYESRRQKLISKFGLFFDMKFDKVPCTCYKCYQNISFTYDPDYIAIAESQKSQQLSKCHLDYWEKDLNTT